jgi:signal transduction histidine kinase
LTRDGSRKLISWSNTALTGPDGSVEFVIGTGIDVSELRQVEAQLRALNDSLECQVAERTAMAENRAAQVRAMALELTKAEQRERGRLARILHDHLQQLLVGARFRVSALRGWSQEAASREMILELDGLLGQAIEDSRSLTFDLSPPVLHEEGLSSGLSWLARKVEATHGLRVDVETEGGAEPASQALSLFLFEAVRELLFNVVKHADAPQARVRLKRSGDSQIEIRVEDDGAGFTTTECPSGSTAPGLGLFSVRERLELLGGHMEIRSAPGQGTAVRLLAPCRKKSKKSPLGCSGEELLKENHGKADRAH